MKRKILLIVLIILILSFGGTIVYASIVMPASLLEHDTTNSKIKTSKVQAAIDEIDQRCRDYCPKGYTCKDKVPVCRRASTLHTETCQQSSYYCSAVEGNGNTITYGQIGTSGTLTPGDAFDCDTNGNGTYDQRFYYVSDYYDTGTKSFNGNVAVLIYYSNTLNGSVNNSGSTYDSNNTNYNGPRTAASHLPTTTQWSNINLYKTNRQILTPTNTTSTSGGNLPVFNYSNYAARLLTYQEVYNGCYNSSTAITNTGGLNNCNFLMENTQYSNSSLATFGLWLETPNTSDRVYLVNVYNRVLGNITATNTHGVRPVIDVLKSKIQY